MAIGLVCLLDVAANAANVVGNQAAPASRTATEGGFLSWVVSHTNLATVPEWVQLLGLLIGILAVIAAYRVQKVLYLVEAKLPLPEVGNPTEFTEMLCTQVWQHTDQLRDRFAERMRMPPADIGALRVLVRLLREDLAVPLNFVGQMHCHPPARWPSAPLFNVYSNWAGQVASMGTQLADLNQQLTYPLLREPVDSRRDAVLVYQFHTERAFLDRSVDALRDQAFDVCEAATKVLEAERKKKKKIGDLKPFWNSDKEEEESEAQHKHCPCCRRAPDQHGTRRRDPLAPVVLPPPPAPPPPPPPPPAAVCRCAAPTMCHCQRCCVCSCTCTPAPPPKPAA